MRRLYTAILALTVAVTSAISFAQSPSSPPKIAIIIDDIGYSQKQGAIAARFPAPLTLAVLPFGPNSHKLAKLGHQHGKEIMLHAPMSTLMPHPLDRGALLESMDHATFLKTLRENIAAIPYITGLNNHMGSALTQHQQSMHWLMKEIRQQGLFFIDSRTTAASVALSTAQQHAIPSRSRDVFLDHERTTEAVDKQFHRLLKIAHKEGSAIAIGHPVKVTMDYLSTQLHVLDEQGIQLVNVSELITHNPEISLAAIPPQPTQAPLSIKPKRLPQGYFPEDRIEIPPLESSLIPPEQAVY